MSIQSKINTCISSQSEPTRSEMATLHDLILRLMPGCQLWFLDGKNDEGKIVSNPNIGYGSNTMSYANGTTRDFYRIGLSANTACISVYIMGMPDKKFLSEKYGDRLGKARVTGYCIKFKTLKDIKLDVLEAAIQYGAKLSEGK